MDRAPALGAPVIRRALWIAACLLAVSGAASARERYAVIVAGATGGQQYAQQYEQWTHQLHETLVTRMQFPAESIVLLTDTADAARAATRANVRRVLGAIRERMKPDDLLFVMLIGHGTFDGVEAKFNLVGPDMESGEWASLLRGMAGRLVIVNSASASFPFLERLAGPRRIVISATDSAAQRFDTVFPDHFIAALGDEKADIDKNGRVSVWEAFAAASGGVREHYQQRGQLTTERSLLDDTGDGVGREAAEQGEDGSVAARTYLDVADPGAPPTDDVLVDLLQRRASLMAEAEELQLKKAFMPADEYAREFERVMIEAARVARAIRERRGTYE